MSNDRKPWIVCAAIRHYDIIIAGARHFDPIMHLQINYVNNSITTAIVKPSQWEQGFIDQWGKFYNRQEAMQVVKESGQPFNAERNGGNGNDLYSEGLY